MRINRQVNKINKGFTLIEVMVSMSIFTMVATVTVGVLLVMVDANRKAQNIQSAMTNLSFALDSMTRDIRTGSDYFCDATPGNGGSNNLPVGGTNVNDCISNRFSVSMAFNEGGSSLTAGCFSNRVAFRYENNSIERRLCSGAWEEITPPEVNITSMQFIVTGTNKSDIVTPTATIYIAGYVADKNNTDATFEIETTVSQQLLDLP